MVDITCEKRIYSRKIDSHLHGYAQLIIPLVGELLIKTDNKNMTVNDEKVFFLPPKCIHQFNSVSHNEFMVLDIPANMTKDRAMNQIDGGIAYDMDDRWKAIRYLLNQEMIKDNSKGVRNLYNYFSEMLEGEPKFKSIEYINKNYNENISLETLAGIEHYNKQYYSEWFKKVMGKTVKQHIKELRVEEAKKLLANSNYSLMQIANIVGYNHHSSLTRVFKEVENMTPNDFKIRI